MPLLWASLNFRIFQALNYYSMKLRYHMDDTFIRIGLLAMGLPQYAYFFRIARVRSTIPALRTAAVLITRIFTATIS